MVIFILYCWSLICLLFPKLTRVSASFYWYSYKTWARKLNWMKLSVVFWFNTRLQWELCITFPGYHVHHVYISFCLLSLGNVLCCLWCIGVCHICNGNKNLCFKTLIGFLNFREGILWCSVVLDSFIFVSWGSLGFSLLTWLAIAVTRFEPNYLKGCKISIFNYCLWNLHFGSQFCWICTSILSYLN